jgi:predicted Co/Zn/Cd cation transporter (cation efflux family)
MGFYLVQHKGVSCSARASSAVRGVFLEAGRSACCWGMHYQLRSAAAVALLLSLFVQVCKSHYTAAYVDPLCMFSCVNE